MQVNYGPAIPRRVPNGEAKRSRARWHNAAYEQRQWTPQQDAEAYINVSNARLDEYVVMVNSKHRADPETVKPIRMSEWLKARIGIQKRAYRKFGLVSKYNSKGVWRLRSA